MGERETMSRIITMGCCKEKELASRVKLEIRKIVRISVEEDDLKIDRITYYHQYKGEEVQAVEV
jgi:Tfp pilus assembly PilM family ATPase